jgi:hypothetical protein
MLRLGQGEAATDAEGTHLVRQELGEREGHAVRLGLPGGGTGVRVAAGRRPSGREADQGGEGHECEAVR